MAVAGLRGTGDWGTDERPKNFREAILWRNPAGRAPLTALMAKMGKENTDDPEFSWWEEELNPVRLQLNDGTGMLAGDTTFTVDNGLGGANAQDLVAGDVLLVEKTEVDATYDNEIIVVSSVTSSTVFEAARGQPGTTAASISDDAWFTKIGNAYAEGTDSPNVASRNPTKYYNYAQIFKTAYEHTKTAQVTKSRTGKIKETDKKRKMFDHSVALEYATLFGARYETTGANGKPLRYMGGLLYFFNTYASTQIQVFGSTPTTTNFFDEMYSVFDYETGLGAGDERIVLCGNGALNVMNKAAETSGQVQFTEQIKLYGYNMTKFVTPQGTFYFKTHPLMNVHARYTNSMFIIDPTAIKWRPLRDTHFEDNIQNNDSDTNKGQWLTEGGVEFRHLKTMKYLGNVA